MMSALPSRGRAPRLRPAPSRFRHPVLRAARHVPLRRRALGRDLDLGRVGRDAGARAPRRRRRRTLLDVRVALGAPGRARPHRRRVGRRASASRGARRVRGGRGRDRARLHDARTARGPARAGAQRVRRSRRRHDDRPDRALVAHARARPSRGSTARPTATMQSVGNPGTRGRAERRDANVPRRAGRETPGQAGPNDSSGRAAASIPRFSPGFPPRPVENLEDPG